MFGEQIIRKQFSEYENIVNSHLSHKGYGRHRLLPLWLRTGFLHYFDNCSTDPREILSQKFVGINNKKVYLYYKTNCYIDALLNDTVRKSDETIKVISPSVSNVQNLEKALKILNKHYNFFEIDICLDAIAFISGKNIIAFTAIEEPGIIFLRTRTQYESTLYFCEHMVHEVSHIVLNYIFIDIESYFKIDPFKTAFNSPFRSDKRGLYHVIHALYVLAKIILFFDSLLRTDIANLKEQKIEIIGRLALASYRLENSVEEIKGNYYTEKGESIQDFLINVAQEKGYSSNDTVNFLSLENQSIEYNHEQFLHDNSSLLLS